MDIVKKIKLYINEAEDGREEYNDDDNKDYHMRTSASKPNKIRAFYKPEPKEDNEQDEKDKDEWKVDHGVSDTYGTGKGKADIWYIYNMKLGQRKQGTFATKRQAQKEADRLNKEKNNG